ncbi:hypothetical protein WDU99_03625 [Microbacterium sp. Mu-80]|uniref:Uncharacterized protein n=1 Tax=Microbacterium bandirmense TaxID=3122050 RepID=A0ABU8L7U0_9MICO
MNILLFSQTGAFTAALESLQIDLVCDQATLVTATATDVDAAMPTTITLGAKALPARGRMSVALDRSVIGRNVKRLTPLDGGRRFTRAARRNADLRRAASNADLIVALERDTVLAAWTALHKWSRPGTRGVYGLAPARALLTSRRSRSDTD